MNKSNVLTKTQQYFAVILAVVLSLLVVWAAASGATTISTNISTGGTLSVTGASTLTGLSTHTAGFISDASSTIKGNLVLTGGLNASSTATSTAQNGFNLTTGCFAISGTCIGLATSSTANNSWSGLQTFTGGVLSTASTTFSGQFMVSGPLQASSTLLVTGLSNLTGFISSASSTAVSHLQVRGQLNASSTLSVTGVSSLYGDVNINGTATVTAATGNLSTAGTLGVTKLSTLTGGFVSVASSTAVGSLTVNGSLNASTTAFIDGTLAVTGVATFNNSLTTATSSATTTIAIRADSNGGTGGQGGCLQLTAQNGQLYRMYITAADAAAGGMGTTTSRGSGTQVIAVWETGACQ